MAQRRLISILLIVLVIAPMLPIASPTAVSAKSQQAASYGSPCPAPTMRAAGGVTVSLEATFAPREVISFGLPIPTGAVIDPGTIGISIGDQAVDATVTPLLEDRDSAGSPIGIASMLVQFPGSLITGQCTLVDVTWQGGSVTVTSDPAPFASTSAPSDEVVDQATYTIEEQNGQAALVTTDRESHVYFTAREPALLATFPPGYLATTGIIGHQTSSDQIGQDFGGLRFISDAVTPFGLSAMYQESYPINAKNVVDPTDPEEGYEGWLYDRCVTFLSFYVHTGDARFLREGYRQCSYYVDHIELTGENRGIFTGKPDPDPKYSHLRGLYAYYALTGDEVALEAGNAIAERFLNDQDFVGPYRSGHIESLDGLWTERLLAVSLESQIYGYRLTGNPGFLVAATELVATAHRHITGDAATLAEINPGAPAFPPQNCLIHTASQAAEGNEDEPWCSGWMVDLLVDPLLAYQRESGDLRVDEIFIRLTRYLRDIGTAYFDSMDDTFLHPIAPSAPADDEDQRMLVPLYGAGLDVDGIRRDGGEYNDFLHCLDATAVTAAGLRALRRSGGFDENPIGPFASEGESFLALHEELAFCAAWTFSDQTREGRNPANWTAEDLAEGLTNPADFIDENNIGNITHNVSPRRKLSWWFNSSLQQFDLLREAGVTIPSLRSGIVQPGDVPAQPMPTTGPALVATAPPKPTATAAPTSAPDTPTPTALEGGSAATGEGQLVYTVTGGSIYRIAADRDAPAERLNDGLAALAPPAGVPVDHWAGASPDGEWLLVRTERFHPDCAGWACLVVVSSDLASHETILIDGQAIHPASDPSAISDDGNLVVYADAGGPHGYDLWAVVRENGVWRGPILLTAASSYEFHGDPSISSDGERVVLYCGGHQYAVDNTALCEVATDGSGFRVLLTPSDGPAGPLSTATLRHPAYARDGSVLFVTDWTGWAIWRFTPNTQAIEQIGAGFTDDLAVCALPDGRIASLWSGRAGNDDGAWEVRIIAPEDDSYVMLVTEQNVEALTCSF